MKRTTKTLLAGTVGAAGLFLASTTNASASTTVKVNQHDTVWALSQKYGVSIKSIETLNHIDGNSHLILTNQSLTIPNKGETASAPAAATSQKTSATSTVKVANGDSLWKIAKEYNISIDQLRSLNGLSSDTTLILPGQELKVTGTAKAAVTTATTNNTVAAAPKAQTATAAPATAATQTKTTPQVTVSANHVTYTVKAGDSLYTVAQAYGISVDALRAANNLGSTLSVGQTLTINDPTKTPATQAASTSSASSTTSTAATQSSTQVASSTTQQSAAQSSSQQPAAQSSAAQTSQQPVAQASSVATQSSTPAAPAQSSSAAATTSNTVRPATRSYTATANNNNNTAAATQQTQTKTVASGSVTSVATQIASMGIPYVNGGSSLSGFDCSGFTQYVFAKAGISIPRTSQAQSAIGTAKSVSSAQPGDLLFWGGRGNAYHVGIYLGGSSYAAAPEPGESVSVKSFTYYQPSFAVSVN
ncbi:C40 family peptidase [Liquorilactobacillus capillatus]|uniref:Surface antigen n=1 Tax=Liquorilactobacillus capillatus DSM 19910 TaxID=1423731 RepID=A0A0R1MAB4_9LACO|nr:C40 family peptidase [Liquorilactobacillus capillatus]KRL02002.1 Surface antigen [Liquorilactobacillus capillatus DSM 19910]